MKIRNISKKTKAALLILLASALCLVSWLSASWAIDRLPQTEVAQVAVSPQAAEVLRKASPQKEVILVWPTGQGPLRPSAAQLEDVVEFTTPHLRWTYTLECGRSRCNLTIYGSYPDSQGPSRSLIYYNERKFAKTSVPWLRRWLYTPTEKEVDGGKVSWNLQLRLDSTAELATAKAILFVPVLSGISGLTLTFYRLARWLASGGVSLF